MMIVGLYVIRTLQTVIVCCCCLLLNINAQSYEFLTMAMDNGKNSRNSVKVKMKTLIRLQSWRQCDNLSGQTLKILTINLKIRILPPENLIFDRETENVPLPSPIMWPILSRSCPIVCYFYHIKIPFVTTVTK